MERSQEGDVYIPSASNNPEGTIKSRGTKNMMEGIRELLGGEIEDIKPLEIDEDKIKNMDPNTVVNARYKKIIDIDKIASDEEESNDGYILDDDLF
jgi:hypothetical protein